MSVLMYAVMNNHKIKNIHNLHLIYGYLFSRPISGVYSQQYGGLILTNDDRNGIFRVRLNPALDTLGVDIVPSADGSLAYVFDQYGRQLHTFSTANAMPLLSYEYDNTGKLFKINDLINFNSLVINRQNNKVSINAPTGEVTELTIQGGKLTQVIDPEQHHWDMTYYPENFIDGGGLIKTFSNRRGKETIYTYNNKGRLVSDANPIGGGWKLISPNDPSKEIIRVSGEGVTTAYKTDITKNYYDETITTTIIKHSDGTETKTIYKGDNTTTTTSDNTKITTTSAKDERFIGLAVPYTHKVKIVTGDSGNRKTLNIQVDKKTELANDFDPFSDATITTTTQINGKKSETIATANHSQMNFTTSTSSLKETLHYIYTQDGKLNILHGSNTQSYTGLSYYPKSVLLGKGQLRSIAQSNNIEGFEGFSFVRTTSFTYDNKNNIKTITNPLGQITTIIERDKSNRIIEIKNHAGQHYNYEYDEEGNRTRLKAPNRVANQFFYSDVDQRIIWGIPPENSPSIVKYDYNKDQQLTNIVLPSAKEIFLAYHNDGRLNFMEDKSTSQKWQYTYHPANTGAKLHHIITPDLINLEYNYSGSFPKSEELRLGNFHSTITNDYNNDFLLSNKKFNLKIGGVFQDFGLNNNYVYDDDNNLRQAGDLIINCFGIEDNEDCDVPSIKYPKESEGIRPIQKTSQIKKRDSNIPYLEDTGSSVIFKTCRDINRRSDNLNINCTHLTAKDNNNENQTLITHRIYNRFGELRAEAANYKNSDSNALFEIKYETGNYSFNEDFFEGGVLKGRDKLGRIIYLSEKFKNPEPEIPDPNAPIFEKNRYHYTYNDANQLKSVTKNDQLFADYTYDDNGNRTHNKGKLIAEYNLDNEQLIYYIGEDGLKHQYKYDKDGYLIENKVAGKSSHYVYNIFGSLIQAKVPDADNGNINTLNYIIDGRQRRIAKMKNGVLVQAFVYQDQLNPIAELDEQGKIKSTFVYGDRANIPAYMVKEGIKYRILSDQLGSPRMVIRVDTHEIVQRMDFDVLGNVILDTNPAFQPFGFAGGIYDADTGLTQFGARDYDAYSGRWISRDPIDFAGGDANLYAYVGGDSVNFVDPSGLETVVLIGGNRDDPSRFPNLAKNLFPNARLVKIKSFNEMNIVLKSTKNITNLVYLGHAGPDNLFLSKKNIATKDVKSLYINNLSKNASISLIACKTARGEKNSIAQAFANHFQRKVKAYETGVSFGWSLSGILPSAIFENTPHNGQSFTNDTITLSPK